MNLDELVQAAIAKALADYIGALSSMDEGFMGKLADMVAGRLAKKLAESERARIADMQRHAMEDMQRQMMMSNFDSRRRTDGL